MGTKPHHSEAAGIPANCKGYELHSWKRPFEAGLHGFGTQNVITAIYTKLVCLWMQAYLLMKTDQEGVELPLGEGLLEHAQLVWIESCKNIRVSGLHRDVARVLTSMGLSHTIEQLTHDSLFSVDIALAGTS